MSRPLDDRFQEGVDAISMIGGSSGSEEYLMAWEWGEYAEAEGSAQDVADSVAARFNREFPLDFVARALDLCRSGRRDSRAGAVDHWCGK